MIWNFISPTASSDLAFTGGGRTRPLTIVRRRRARGMRLSIDPRDGLVRLTLGQRAPLRPALAWAAGKRAWVEAELARLPLARPIVPGMIFAVDDQRLVIDWNVAQPRAPRIVDDRLEVGGPYETLGPRVLRFLRAQALVTLTAETRALATAHRIEVARIGVGDPRGRWGSCTSSGDIRYSWRLTLAPGHVRRATVAHEVAHRIHMNHGAAFHALVAELYGDDPAPARQWLRAHGTTLHWFGRVDG